MILNLWVEYDANARPRACRHFRSDEAGHPRPTHARACPHHRRGRTVRDVARGCFQARAHARACRPGTTQTPGARAHALARRAAAPPGHAVDLALRAVLERASRSPRGVLCAERTDQMKTFDFTVS